MMPERSANHMQMTTPGRKDDPWKPPSEAVLAERKRCAALARTLGRELEESEGHIGPWAGLGESIARAIEEGKTPPTSR